MSKITKDKKEAARALNCPKAGDYWTEFMACSIYVCDVEEGVVRAMIVNGAGRQALFFNTIANFQDYIMYGSAPVRGIEGWTWVDFVEHEEDCKSWIRDWVEESNKNGFDTPLKG